MSEVGARLAQLLSGLFVFVQADGCAENEGFAVGSRQPVGLLPARKRVLDVTDTSAARSICRLVVRYSDLRV
jgi:hypothetical protein